MEPTNETWKKRFDEKFLYWVVLGSTLNDGSELRWNVGEGKMPDIDVIKSFISEERKRAQTELIKGLQKIYWEKEYPELKNADLVAYAQSLGLSIKE